LAGDFDPALLGASDVAVGGTMVVAVRFREGLVVCADKRSHLHGPGLPKGCYRDDDVKITLVLGLLADGTSASAPLSNSLGGIHEMPYKIA